MKDDSIFLAYREPQKSLRYFHSDSESSEIFHFADFEKKAILKIPMKEGLRPSQINFQASSAQEMPRKEAQEALLSATIADLKLKQGAKVVLSRFLEKETRLSPLEVLDQLDTLYPQATVYCFSHPAAGTWLGATPERLFSVQGHKLIIDSLAGTRQWEARDTFSAKEKEEQAIVTNDILEKLKGLQGIEELRLGSQQIKKAGDLAHLHNEITAKLSNAHAIQQLLALLPPTPAVGGKPNNWAVNYILENELYQRRYYTGYLGWEKAGGKEASFWVNLRCAEWLEGNKLAVYVGGGITADSIVSDEWLETEHKANTILKALEA